MKKRKQVRSRKPKPPIAHQETIKEVETKSFEIVRLSRVRYQGNRYTFIDIRFFQRGYGSGEEEVLYPTKKGVQLKEELFLKLVNQTVLLGLKRRLRNETG